MDKVNSVASLKADAGADQTSKDHAEKASEGAEPAASAGLSRSMESTGFVKSIMAALSFSLLLMAFTYLLFHPVFETNDDIGMILMASGLAYGRAPDCHILFSHIGIGTLLSSLYSWNIHIPWYGLYLSVCNFLALSILCFSFVWRRPLKFALVLFAIFYAAALMHIVDFLQFTTCSSLLCISALALLFRLVESSKIKFEMAAYATVVALLVLGSMIRIESLGLFSVIATMTFSILLLPDWNKCLRAGATVALAFVLSIGLYVQHLSAYGHDPGWNYWVDINHETAPYTNYGLLKSVLEESSAAQAVKWGAIEGKMLADWNYLDKQNFSLEKFRLLRQHIKPANISVVQKLKELLSVATDITLLPLALLELLCLCFAAQNTKIRLGLIALANFSLIVLLCVVLKIPQRVYLPMFSFLTMVSLWAAFVPNPALVEKISSFILQKKNRAALFASVWALLAGFAIWSVQVFKVPEERSWLQHDKLLKAVTALHPNKQDVYVTLSYGFDGIMPFDDITRYFDSWWVCPSGVLCQSPVTTDIARQLGVGNVLLDLVNPHIRFLSYNGANDNIVEYLRTRYHINVAYDMLQPFPVNDSGLKIYSWHRAGLNEVPPVDKTSACLHGNLEKLESSLQLYPSDKFNWGYANLNLRKPRNRLLNFFSDFVDEAYPVAVCPDCKTKPNKAQIFDTRGVFPTISSFQKLEIDPRDYSHFYIDMAASDEVSTNRAALVQFNINSAHPLKIQIPLVWNDKMHHYEFPLEQVGFNNGEIIRQMNVHPVFLRKEGEKSHFSIRRFGFVKN